MNLEIVVPVLYLSLLIQMIQKKIPTKNKSIINSMSVITNNMILMSNYADFFSTLFRLGRPFYVLNVDIKRSQFLHRKVSKQWVTFRLVFASFTGLKH